MRQQHKKSGTVAEETWRHDTRIYACSRDPIYWFGQHALCQNTHMYIILIELLFQIKYSTQLFNLQKQITWRMHRLKYLQLPINFNWFCELINLCIFMTTWGIW